MEKPPALDSRKLPRKAMEQLRVSTVRRVERGESPADVAAAVGVNRRTICRWHSAYNYRGVDAFKTMDEMVQAVKSVMRSIQKSPSTVAGFFRAPKRNFFSDG